MNVLDGLFSTRQYSIPRAEKEALLLDELAVLHKLHYESCDQYRLIQNAIKLPEFSSLSDIPFLPVRLFKELNLQSVPDEAVLKVLTSSGTTSQQVSRIALDRATSLLQTKALASIVTSYLGPKRLPMIIVDSRSILQSSSQMSARGAGVVGLSNFGRDHFYALDDQMRLDITGLREFIRRHASESILIFGFTYMIWEYLVGSLIRLGDTVSLDRCILIHGGGWKKLKESAVGNDVFKKTLLECCGIQRIHDYYGMVEQVGSIYMECEHGFLHAPNFADILIRDSGNWNVLTPGNFGVIESVSVLPRSYPGHALLTEDKGMIHGIDDCLCGRLGTRFTVQGRLPQAELRGCSDTHAYNVISPKSGARGEVLLPSRRDLFGLDDLPGDHFFSQGTLPAFCTEVVAFLDSLSQSIFSLKESLADPQLAALGYWLRRSNISRLVQEFIDSVGSREIVVARGTAFHVAPANVEAIFFYSWALSLLAGNSNIVRIPTDLSPPMLALLTDMGTMLEEPIWGNIACRNVMLSYPRDDEFNRYFSKFADIRVIWGGDNTALHFRELPAKPVVKDLVFGDKISLTVIDAVRYLAQSKDQVFETARLFHNDAYQFNQMACSSPQIVYFIGDGEQCEAASRRFWLELTHTLLFKGADSSLSAMDKLVFGFRSAAYGAGGHFPYGLPTGIPTVMRVEQETIPFLQSTCGGGFFFECFASNLEQLAHLVQSNAQTLTYAGFEKDDMVAIGKLLCARGIDRIVPVGKALEFAPVWDGYVLFSELTRRVSIL